MKCKYSRESRSDLWWERKRDVYTAPQRVCMAEKEVTNPSRFWASKTEVTMFPLFQGHRRSVLCLVCFVKWSKSFAPWTADSDQISQMHLNCYLPWNQHKWPQPTSSAPLKMGPSNRIPQFERNQGPAAKHMTVSLIRPCVSLFDPSGGITDCVRRANNQNLLRQSEGKAPLPIRRQIERGAYKFTFILAVWLPSTAKCGIMAARRAPCR